MLSLGHVDPKFAFWATSGEFAFVAILAGEAQIMLLDEPTSGVATDKKSQVMDMVIEALKANRVTVLNAQSELSHSVDLIQRESVIEYGEILKVNVINQALMERA